jgi:hypothetical protein
MGRPAVAWLGRLPGYEAIAVDAEGEVFMTAGFAAAGAECRFS